MKSVLIGTFVACLWLFAAALTTPEAGQQQQQQTLPACADRDLFITADQKIEVYVDGVHANLTNANDWRKTDTVKVPASAKVVAVRAESRGRAVGGILASAGPDFVTDRSWRCTAAYAAQGWEAASFDDSRWSAAASVAGNGEGRWEKIAGIDSNASWIWTRRFSSDDVVFCRKTLPPCNPCPGTGTGPACIASCVGRLDGDYQSCKGCDVYATCSNGILSDDRRCTPGAPGAPALVWDDALKRCEYTSETCKTCVIKSNENVEKPAVIGTGPTCITSCKDRLDGDYQSCKGCKVYATCSNGILTDDRQCAPSNPPLVWDDAKKTCERESATCRECA